MCLVVHLNEPNDQRRLAVNDPKMENDNPESVNAVIGVNHRFRQLLVISLLALDHAC
jgi:hypothetical protein